MEPRNDLSGAINPKLRWLMFARVVITSFLLMATLYLQYRHQGPVFNALVTILYLIIAAIFFLSLLYAAVFHRIRRHGLFAYVQIGMDALIVSIIVFITGGYFSIFSFLYLVVIIYASMILFMRGGLIIALWSSVLFALLVLFQFSTYAVDQFTLVPGALAFQPTGFEIAYKISITTAACLAVAVLCGLLTEQNRKTQKKLRIMESHVKQVEKMAYMGEMAAGLAHEIKNPLASLVGSIQLLKEELRYDADHRRLMEIVLRETDRLSSLVNDFLFFARPPAGKVEVMHLKEAVEEIIRLFEKDAHHARRFEIQTDLVGDVWVSMDPTHFRQVLWNLLLNAAEAVPDGGSIRIRTATGRGNAVTVAITDNGCGIPAEVLQSIFDPFFTTKPEGTGLGLSIVHRILESYGSQLDVRTAEGGGTTVSFELHRTTPALKANGATASTSPAKRTYNGKNHG